MKNSKLLLILLALFLSSQMALAQQFDPILFKKGDVVLNAGVGILPTFSSPTVDSRIPPVSLNAEYRIAGRFSVGAFAAYATTGFSSDLPEHKVIPRSSESEQYLFGLRASIHHEIKKTGFYGGLLFGYNHENTVTNISQSTEDDIPRDPTLRTGKPIYTAYVGMRQMFTNNLGVYGEVGYGISIFNFGLSVKL